MTHTEIFLLALSWISAVIGCVLTMLLVAPKDYPHE